jgi:hypothetical protein
MLQLQQKLQRLQKYLLRLLILGFQRHYSGNLKNYWWQFLKQMFLKRVFLKRVFLKRVCL